jgi:CopG family nickel-responsive transcriptional regulator
MFITTTNAYVYNHHERELSRRLTETQHDHYDLSVATLHVDMSHDDCLEAVVLKGDVAHVRALADSVSTQRGVRLSRLHLIPA